MSVTVQGPDGNNYEFPDGTDKAAAVAYFKKKGITSAKPSPAPGPKWGTRGDVLGNVWEHAKGLVTGPIQAIGRPPETPDEMTVANMPQLNIPGALGAYRMLVEPTVNALQEFANLRVQGGPQASILHGSTWDPATGERTPTAGSKLVDAIPIYGPWAAQTEEEAHKKGILPAAAGLTTDVVGGELMGKLPKFLSSTARRGAQTLLGAGPDATRRAVEAENTRVANREQFVAEADAELKKQFLDRLDVSMKEDQGVLTEHEARVNGLDEKHRTAQREHQQDLRALHDRNLEKARQNQLDETERLNRNAEKTGKYRKEVQDVKNENIRKKAEHEADQRKAQQDWDELNKAHGQGQEAIASRDVMEQQVQKDLKALEDKVNQEANKKYNDLRAKMKDTSILREDAAEAVTEAYEWVRGSPDKIKQFKFISDMERHGEGPPAPLKWNDLQGYLEEFRKTMKKGGMDGDLYKAVESMHDFIEDEMGKLAEENGTATEWTDAQASWRKYKSTFIDKKSPIAKAINARTSDVGAQGFMGRKVMTEDPALGNLRDYDPALYGRIQRLREVSGAAKAAPGAPKPLSVRDEPVYKDPEEVPLPKTEDEPIPFDRGFENPDDLKMPEPKGTAEAPPAKPLRSPMGKKFEEQVIDVPGIKEERVRNAARRFSEIKEGDPSYLATGVMAPFVFVKKLLAARLDRPLWIDFLTRPSAGDLAALEDLPPEAKAKAQGKINDFIKANPAVKVHPQVKRLLVTPVAASTSAEQRARDAARRLQEQSRGIQLTD